MEEKPEGLLFFEKAVLEPFQQVVESWFYSDKIQDDLFAVGKENSRKVIHYGYAYNYSSGKTTEKAPDFPHIILLIQTIIKKLWKDCPPDLIGDVLSEDSGRLNQCIINRYIPGQGIGAHTDRNDYGDIIVCFTFGGGREMEFTRDRYKPYKIYTPPGSMYIMTGESRYEWMHQMRGRKRDRDGWKTVERENSFSITFREVPI